MVKHVQTTVGDGVLDVPRVGFYATTHATTPDTRLTNALNKANNYLTL